jgi:hypothetical protein
MRTEREARAACHTPRLDDRNRRASSLHTAAYPADMHADHMGTSAALQDTAELEQQVEEGREHDREVDRVQPAVRGEQSY